MALKSIIPFGKKSVALRRDDENPFALLRREMDSLYDTFFNGGDLEPFESVFRGFSPKIDVTENDKEITISAELPGIDEKDIEVALQNDMLTIKGEKKEEKEEKGNDYYRKERSYGSFSRAVQIPGDVETEKVEAKFTKGVLTITLPRSPQAVAEKKKVEIKSE
jgi:HSP20 family protein